MPLRRKTDCCVKKGAIIKVVISLQKRVVSQLACTLEAKSFALWRVWNCFLQSAYTSFCMILWNLDELEK